MSIHSDYLGHDTISVGNGQNLPISHIVKTTLTTPSHSFYLTNLLRIPQISSNLLSVNQFCKDNNYSFHFDAHSFTIQDNHSKKILYQGKTTNGLYPFHASTTTHISSTTSAAQVHIGTKVTNQLWHDRLGHPHNKTLQHALSNSTSEPSCSHSTITLCEHCLKGKLS